MAVAFVAVVLLLPSVLLVIWWMQNSRKRKLINMIPGPSALPLVGNAHQLKSGGNAFFVQFTGFGYTFGKSGLFRLWFGPHPAVAITTAETAEVLLTSSQNIGKSFFYDFLLPWLGTGLLISTGEKWHRRRKMLTPTFHFKILSDFLQVFNEQADVMVKRLDQKVDKGSFDMTPYVTLCTLDIICDSAMGRHINAQANADSNYVKAICRFSELYLDRVKKPWQWPNFIYALMSAGKEQKQCLEILHGFTNKVIRERRAEFEEKSRQGGSGDFQDKEDDDDDRIGRKRKRLALLDLLLETNIESDGRLTNEDIREEVDTFMFEGHDTTAAAINWVIHLVGANPEVQKKLQQELDRIFGESNRQVTVDDIKELKYLECIIKEALRLFPSVPYFARCITEEFKIDGYIVPKDVTAIIMPSVIHMDPKHFPDPERFDPDRWLPENSVGRHPFCFIPFSAGPRNCIGQKFAMMEEKVLLAYIFRRFEITSLQTREDLRPSGEIILRPENGIFVKMDRR